MDRQSGNFPTGLHPNLTPGAQILEVAPLTWRLCIPAGPVQLPLASWMITAVYPGDISHGRRTSISLWKRAPAIQTSRYLGIWVWNDPLSMVY